MHKILTAPLLIIFLLTLAPVALADTTPERTRVVIDRSVDNSIHDRSSRDREDTDEENEPEDDDEEGEGTGVTLDVTYDSESGLEVNFETNGNTGNADITVVINGQTVSDTGGRNNNGNNNSSDGQDGANGSDGNSGGDDEEDQGEEAEVESEEEQSSRQENRPDRELDPRSSSRDSRG